MQGLCPWRPRVASLVLVLLAGHAWGGTPVKLERSTSQLVKTVAPPDDGLPRDDEVHDAPSPGIVTIKGASAAGFNAVGADIAFVLAGESFSEDPDAVKAYRAGWPLPSGTYMATTSTVEISAPVLQEGRNRLSLWAEDGQGRMIEFEAVLWAGSLTLRVDVEDASGQPVANAEVSIMLEDDDTVGHTGITDAKGVLLVSNLPARTVLLEGRKGKQLFGSAAAHGSDGTMRLRLHGFNTPSMIDN